MKFMIPSARAGVDQLIKATFSRGPRAGYKYVKREPYFVNGKMRYRYYYEDDATRVQGKSQHDPDDTHEHLLIDDIRKVHENLAGTLKSVIQITLRSLSRMFGFKKELPVTTGEEFKQRYVEPAIQREKEGAEPVRAPMTRIETAFSMLPSNIKKMLDPANQPKGSNYGGLKRFAFNSSSEDSVASSKPGVLGWARSTDGELHIIGPSFRDPIGEAKFNSNLTLAEEVIWHEAAHHVHYTLENAAPSSPEGKALSKWRAGLPGNRISRYAYTNWREDFAESFACAMSHPKQLARVSPERYDWMREHVLTETLPTREEINNTPNEELAWWDSAAVTPASRVLSYLKAKVPAPAFADYISDKDQFYSVNVNGRTAYLRMGPSDKEQEAGWDRMPDTTYTEEITGADGKPISVTLPVHDVNVGPRFKAKQTIKEIYDENGRPLTSEQAYFYLGQNNDKVIAHAEKGGDDPQDYLEWQRKQFGPKLSAAEKKKMKSGGRSAMDAYVTKQNILIPGADEMDDTEFMAAIEERSGEGKT
ncbi:hypothetical protein K0U83_09795, partial [bacterium]|nr:hypothetical protein [bacterium]